MAEKVREEKFELRKCQSSAELLQNTTAILPNRLRPSLGLYSVPRCTSNPDLAAAYNRDPGYISQKHYSSSAKYYRNYDMFDDYFWDRRHGTSSLFWPARHWPNRHYYYNDRLWSLMAHYPDLGHYPKHERGAFLDHLDPVGWYHYKDPRYHYNYNYPYKPWILENADKGLSAKMYRQKLISYPTVERNWLIPSQYQRWDEEYGYPFKVKPWQTSPRRYFYTFDAM